MYTKNNKIKLFKTIDDLEFKQLTPKEVNGKTEGSLLGRAGQ